jgi:phenylpyruvate tautomerase PptA (4-oxalocrotonate tautomerase family)
MPLLQIYTTLAKSKIPANFAAKTATLLTQVLNKPLKAIVVNVNADQNIFSGIFFSICLLSIL